MSDRDVSSDLAVIRAQMTAMSETQRRIEKELIGKVEALDEKVEALIKCHNDVALELTAIKTAQSICTAGERLDKVEAKVEKAEKDVVKLNTTGSNTRWGLSVAIAILAAIFAGFEFFSRGGII